MKEFKIAEITGAVGGELIKGEESYSVKGFSIDSREISEGQMFFAIVGERNDGHDYIRQVADKGCNSVVISDIEKLPEGIADINVILVENTTRALQSLAAYYLDSLHLKKKIGITGSVGKTSTRDFMYYVSSVKYKTGRNKKNYNNAHGLPLSILEFDEDTEVAVLEMGMDAPGEIKLLTEIVKPDIAIITKIAEVNIAMMKNLDNILKAKMEITTCFNENSTLVVNAACPYLAPEKVSGNYNLITVGGSDKEDYQISDVCDFGDKGIKYTLSREHNSYEIELPTAGAHNAFNAALAIAAGEILGISPDEAAKGLRNASLTGKRLNICEKDGIKVIDDTYNACEDSVKSAIDTLMATEGKRKIAILGDILGLAERAKESHSSVGRYAGEKGADILVAIGDDARYYAEGAKESMDEGKVMFLPEKEDFIRIKDQVIREGDVVLVKASRGMEMEKIVSKILEG